MLPIQKYNIVLDNLAIMDRCESSIQQLKLSPMLSKNPNTILDNIISDHHRGDARLRYTGVYQEPHQWTELRDFTSKVISHGLPNLNNWKHSWFNIMTSGSEILDHWHPPAKKFVCVYYAQSLPEHPPIEFYYEQQWHSIPVTTGDYIIFPQFLRHQVPKQDSIIPRYSFSFNI